MSIKRVESTPEDVSKCFMFMYFYTPTNFYVRKFTWYTAKRVPHRFSEWWSVLFIFTQTAAPAAIALHRFRVAAQLNHELALHFA